MTAFLPEIACGLLSSSKCTFFPFMDCMRCAMSYLIALLQKYAADWQETSGPQCSSRWFAAASVAALFMVPH